jgi:hypothetical protein
MQEQLPRSKYLPMQSKNAKDAKNRNSRGRASRVFGDGIEPRAAGQGWPVCGFGLLVFPRAVRAAIGFPLASLASLAYLAVQSLFLSFCRLLWRFNVFLAVKFLSPAGECITICVYCEWLGRSIFVYQNMLIDLIYRLAQGLLTPELIGTILR